MIGIPLSLGNYKTCGFPGYNAFLCAAPGKRDVNFLENVILSCIKPFNFARMIKFSQNSDCRNFLGMRWVRLGAITFERKIFPLRIAGRASFSLFLVFSAKFAFCISHLILSSSNNHAVSWIRSDIFARDAMIQYINRREGVARLIRIEEEKGQRSVREALTRQNYSYSRWWPLSSLRYRAFSKNISPGTYVALLLSTLVARSSFNAAWCELRNQLMSKVLAKRSVRCASAIKKFPLFAASLSAPPTLFRLQSWPLFSRHNGQGCRCRPSQEFPASRSTRGINRGRRRSPSCLSCR